MASKTSSSDVASLRSDSGIFIRNKWAISIRKGWRFQPERLGDSEEQVGIFAGIRIIA